MDIVITTDFKANVNELLARKKITRTELARRLDCSPAFVTQLLSEKYDPGLGVVEKVATALHVPVHRLLKKIPQSTD